MQNLLNILNVSWLWISWFIAVSNLIFEAILTHELTLTAWTEPWTFARNSIGTVKNSESKIEHVLIKETRHEGARREYNLVPESENFSWETGWTLVDNAINSYDGRLVATQFVESNLTEIHRVLHTSNTVIVAGRTYVTSIQVKGNWHNECSFQWDVTNNSLWGLSVFDINTWWIISQGANILETWY